MALQAMWTHGHHAVIEFNNRGRGGGEDVNGVPWTAINGLRVGWGAIFRCQDQSSYWFHFAIPTPVIKDNVRARFRRAFVLYTADPGVALGSVHVWDGTNRIFTRDGLAVGGSHPGFPLEENINAFNLPDEQVFFGVGISALFNFADAGNVTLHNAGIDFEI